MHALAVARAAQARIFALRGQADEAARSLDWLESAVREAGAPEYVVIGLASTAIARATLGQHEAVAALLTEIEAFPGSRRVQYYGVYLPEIVRTAVGIGDLELAQRLVVGYNSPHPYATHAVVTVNATLAEADGNLKAAADRYADAAERWQTFGVVPEQAFTLLGQGRSLAALGQPAEAAPALQAARAIFAALQAAPALAETEALLRQAEQLSAQNG